MSLRTVLCLALLLCAALQAGAQTDYSVESVWNGTDASTFLRTKSLIDPSCFGNAGSATNPYLIESAADLKYLQKTTGLYGKCFEQMVDIDLGDFATHGKLLGTIGSSANGNTPFTGKYDGRGHKIKNLRVEWNTTSNVACGLFGYLRGEVRNLVIDKAWVTRGEGATATAITGTDFKIGVLAGCVAPDALGKPAVIENISIINSRIDDGGKNSDIKAAFIGGLVGDISNGFGGTHRMDKYGQVTIRNIYSEVEIDLPNYKPNGNNAFQFNVGGIFGRMRRGMEEDLPTNTIFTGSINAPNGMVGPIFGASRADGGNDEKGMRLFYAGQVTPEEQQYKDGNPMDEPTIYHFIDAATFNATNKYYDFQLWDDREGEKRFVDVDDTTPSKLTTLPEHTQSGITRGASFRSFTEPSATSTKQTYSDIGMTKFQGVNKGGLLAGATEAAKALSGFDFEYKWSLDTSTKDATLEVKTPAEHSLAAEHTAWNKFTATLTGADAGFHYRWFAVSETGVRSEIGLSDSNVLEGSYPIPQGTTELIVFLCNADDTYYLDNGHYVYTFCLPKYIAEGLEFTATPAADKAHTILTPKLKVKNVQEAEDIVETTSFDGWEFEVKVYRGNTLKYTFPDKFAGADAPFSIPPTVSEEAKIEITGTINGLSITSSKVEFPYYLRGNSTTGWKRELLSDGQHFTLTFGNVSKNTGSEVYGDKVYFDSSKTLKEDWGLDYNWEIGYYVADGNSFNGLKDKDLTESEEWEESGQLKCWIKDQANYSRYYRLTLTDLYGFSFGNDLKWGKNWIGSPHNNGRTIVAMDDFQTYWFKYSWYDEDLESFIPLLPELGGKMTYTYSTDNGTTYQALDCVTNNIFILPKVYLTDKTYMFKYTDNYGLEKEFSSNSSFSGKLTVSAPDIVLVNKDGKAYPCFEFNGKSYTIDKDEKDLDFNWEVTYLDESDNVVATMPISDGNISELITSRSDAAKVEVRLTVTDCENVSKVATETVMLSERKVTISATGTAPDYSSLTANLSTMFGESVNEGTWQWYGIRGKISDSYLNRTELVGQTLRTLDLTTYSDYDFYCVVWTSEDNSIQRTCFWTRESVIYVYREADTYFYRTTLGYSSKYNTIVGSYPDGNDLNDGTTPYTAVSTMARAYELLNGSNAESNIIVVMGYVADDDYLTTTTTFLQNDKYKKCATIIGKFGEITEVGALKMYGAGSQPLALGGATVFKDIVLNGKYRNVKDDGTIEYKDGELHLYCYLNDLTIGENVKVQNYTHQGVTNGLLENNVGITIVGGMHNYDNFSLDYPSTNAKPGQTTIKVYSGKIGRIIASARNNGAYNRKSNNIFGHPEWPHRVEVIVDIRHNKFNADGTPDITEYEPTKTWKYDVGLIVGGQTDGTVFADSRLELKNGKVGRFIAGNISYGRAVDADKPSDAFFGSTELTIHEGGEIEELVGGTLGRFNSTSVNADKCFAYFYGRSIINLKGGIVNRNIYGAGAGGVTGIGDDDREDFHTKDIWIPYYTGAVDANGYKIVAYGPYMDDENNYVAKGHMPTMELSDQTTLDLAKSYCKVNIFSGTINGHVFGGGLGYSDQIFIDKALDQAGDLFGTAYVNIFGGLVKGNVYGGGSGSDEFIKKKDAYNATTEDKITTDFTKVGRLYGNAYVNLTGGYVEGNVFGGAMGIIGYNDMATVYGTTTVTLDGGEVNGNIYGGCDLSSIRRSGVEDTTPVPETSGSIAEGNVAALANVIVKSGTIGNCIFGGSRGDDTTVGSKTEIDGDTYVQILGGSYKNEYYVTDYDGKLTDAEGEKCDKSYFYDSNGTLKDLNVRPEYRNFNIYGGGQRKCTVKGTAHLDVHTGLMRVKGDDGEYLAEDDIHIFIPQAENPNALESDDYSRFQGAYMDLTYRRFGLYGGGYGEATNCLNTDVYATIPVTLSNGRNSELPHGNTLKMPYDHQSYFDIAGGGYSGDIGYWNSDYTSYIGGSCNVTIDGYTYCRKVIGGGFYGSCNTTNTRIICGSLRQVYGGSLLGYVHKNAKIHFGNRPEDCLDYDEVKDGTMTAAAKAKQLNDYLYITENIYGGNDVKGIIGTERWTSEGGVGGDDTTDGGPLWRTNISDSEDNGILFNIYGGRFMGDVYCAGNGHYRGYYVPGWIRYEDGPTRMYRLVKNINGKTYKEVCDEIDAMTGLTDAEKSAKKKEAIFHHRVYRTRPMVGSVNVNLCGNSVVKKEDGTIDESLSDYVKIDGNFYGGGRECTIGQWRTILPMEDPRRLEQGGHLHINIGGNVHFGFVDNASTIFDLNPGRENGSLYMGVEGSYYANQQFLPLKPFTTETEVDLNTFDGSTTSELNKVGQAAYDHWWFNPNSSAHDGRGRYEPGYPAPGEVDGNFGMTGEHMFRAYMKNIEMQGDVELTFYKNLYETKNGNKVRKHWIPAELAVEEYDAENVMMNSFFLGGQCGSMTNNNVMIYCYDTALPLDFKDEDAKNNVNNHKHEKFGSIYRVTIPKNVTIRNKLVMGSEKAVAKYYPYNANFTGISDDAEAPYYTFEGGMVTQSAFSFDYIAYNDYMADKDPTWTPKVKLPSGFYDEDSEFKVIWNSDTYTFKDGSGTVIHRKPYVEAGHTFTNVSFGGGKITDRRYGLAVTRDDKGNESAYIGEREFRSDDGTNHLTVSKLTARCTFEPQDGVYEVPDDQPHSEAMARFDKLYGGIIYGGCYDSGIISGDVILNVSGNLMGSHIDTNGDSDWFGHISGLGHYIGRIYGGGYGDLARNDGDVYINLLRDVQAMNVFGGGMLGHVYGDTHINYIGSDQSYIYGAIYGGGFMGQVGKFYEQTDPDTDETYREVRAEGTRIKLFSGNVDKVYGGSCMGDVYGATSVELCDEVTTSLDHLDYEKLVENHSIDGWGASRLVVGTVFGGNDISGNIFHTPEPWANGNKPNDTNVLIQEIRQEEQSGGASTARAVKGDSDEALAPQREEGKNTPGAVHGYNGYPLVGNLYGGSNGNYGTQGTTDKYLSGTVRYANGEQNETETIELSTLTVPHVDRAELTIKGGTVVNVYGGGDMSNILESTKLNVEYVLDQLQGDEVQEHGNMDARAGFHDEAELDRVWNTCHVTSRQQLNEVMDESGLVFKYNIFRIFGGNNHADMHIQPTWNLQSAHIGSVYSGANFGRMTYSDPGKAEIKDDEGEIVQAYVAPKGLTLEINSRWLHANAVYGGGRVGDIVPNMLDMQDNDPADPGFGGHGATTATTPPADLYGANLIIRDGVIDHVYGGNDVSGTVHYGSKVEIYGAISGDVYCAGNGNYVYQYDPSRPSTTLIEEQYMITDTEKKSGYRYFILPCKPGYGGETPSNAQKVLAINSYRPNVTRSSLLIQGQSQDNPAYVHGSIYMGGNSATIFAAKKKAASGSVVANELDDQKFTLGSHVVINSIFMGANGEWLVNDKMMEYTSQLNYDPINGELNYAAQNDLTVAQKEELEATMTDDEYYPSLLESFDHDLYPTLLDLYMRAVDVEGLPKDFTLDSNIENANIGDFYLGGNRGSMTTNKPIILTFPENITIFGKIVGGSNDANFKYGTAAHVGGLTRKLASYVENGATVTPTDKVHLIVKSDFRPKYLKYPDGNWRSAELVDDIRDTLGVPLYRKFDGGEALTYYAYDKKTETYSNPYDGKTYLSSGSCNIYGGCYNSGETVGNVKIDLYSDMLLFGPQWKGIPETDKSADEVLLALRTREQTVVNGINGIGNRSWHTCSVIGGGYGASTSVYGDINVRLLPTVTGEDDERKVSHPSCAAIFGGAQEGLVVGNTTVELRDGTVLTNVYGASESSYMYGSTQILIGYPEHYECLVSGNYPLERADIYSKAAKWTDTTNPSQKDWSKNQDGSEVIKQSVWYRKGDIVPKNVYDRIVAADATKAENFTSHAEDSPADFVAGATWNDIQVSVGDPSSRNARTKADIDNIPYFGHGNVYGGGFVPTAANSALIGQKTLLRFKENFQPEDISDIPSGHSITSYGGNSSIMIWDNKENAELNDEGSDYKYAVGSLTTSGDTIKDHVSIGTARFVEVAMKEGANKMGLYYFKPEGGSSSKGEFVHQPSGNYSSTADAGKHFYDIESDGGIYGGGRKVYYEGFSACDLAYYGYADNTPQMAKLVNTFQRLDLLSLTDCCLQLQAAQDFAATTADAGEVYSITRVGELRMNSSLTEMTKPLVAGTDDSYNTGNTIHDTKRMRNFLGFFRSVKFLGALVSNVPFESAYHKADGKLRTDATGDTYLKHKKDTIDAYYDILASLEEGQQPTDKQLTDFKRRNVGTSANMIGINNGYSLRLQGTRQVKENGIDVDKPYYGPALGVTEIKLLTMAIGEGGGYVYALNQHEESDPVSSGGGGESTQGDDNDGTELGATRATTTDYIDSHGPGTDGKDTPSFLQIRGNFVFPGAKFGLQRVKKKDDKGNVLKDSDGNDLEEDVICQNYIIDDCFPVGHGYDKYMADATNNSNVNSAQECHYWYVNGQRYFFNATLTAYTETPSSERPMQTFALDNTDSHIMLAGIDAQTQYLRVKSITWEVPEDYNYDLTRTTGKDAFDRPLNGDCLPGYNLYVTVGDQPNELIRPSDSDKKGAWTAELTRDADNNYKLNDTKVDGAGNETLNTAYPHDNINLASGGNGTYSASMPLLGLILTDTVSNNNKNYYNEHLSRPAKVQVVLGACNSDGLDYEYTLNLSIVYLKGTDVFGNIVIENCALPGELIYANAYNVTVEGDEGTTVITSRKWKLYKINTTTTTEGEVLAGTTMPPLEISDDFLVEANKYERIAIPAYYWMDGWHLCYEMTINGKPESVYTSVAEGTEHPVITVHNYHRMMPSTNRETSDIQDLQLSKGARVYIEDDADLDYFLKYMDRVQANGSSRRGKIGTAELPQDYDTHVVVDPQFAEDIHFILMDDVKVKAGTAAQNYRFEGMLSGLGHTIDLRDCTTFMGQNGTKGSMYYLGFLSSLAANSTTIIGENNGRILGCFYYNDNPAKDKRGRFIPDLDLEYDANGKIVHGDNDFQYSYQNAVAGQTDAYGYTSYYDDLDFANGKAAYDLNVFYLNERYKHATNQMGNENSRFKSYVYKYYGDGEYRYANYDKADEVGTATALRTSEHPNYYHSGGTITAEQMEEIMSGANPGLAAAQYGKATTRHNTGHLHDNSRTYEKGHFIEVETNGVVNRVWLPDYYVPNYPQDFIFFGQNIPQGELHPVALKANYSNRVYRASGFYGTQEDRGFYFNRNEAVMRHPQLTAVDFTGQRTRERVPSGDLKQVYQRDPLTYVVAGKVKQTMIFPPVLDLPCSDLIVGTTDAAAMQLDAMSVVGNEDIESTSKVTKNLLVYIPSDKLAEAYPFPQSADQSEITAHRVDRKGTSFSTALFHLVDKQDFNAPIEFDVAKRAWYEREPEDYSSGNNAWDGLCLPFTVSQVIAKSVDGDEGRSHGLLTHFYGPEVGKDNEAESHEYWLRKFNSYDAGEEKAYFVRPTKTDDDDACDYTYHNDWFSTVYGESYCHSRKQYQQYKEGGEDITFEDYPMITAGLPYIIAFPGERYYEFDLSGQFYADKNNESTSVGQTLSYENPSVTVPVSDEAMKTFADNGVSYIGTFMHIAAASDKAVLQSTQFVANKAVLPFRTYLTVPASIGTRSVSDFGFDEEKDEPSPVGVQIFVKDNALVVISDHAFTLPLYGIAGQHYCDLAVHQGTNVFRGLRRGVYITRGYKFAIKAI